MNQIDINIISKKNKTELFSYNHLICIECLIKDLLINKFKKLENEKEITFSCICRIGKLKINFDNLINLQKDFLKPKIPGKCKEHNKDGIKFCKICELWLFIECLNIHKVLIIIMNYLIMNLLLVIFVIFMEILINIIVIIVKLKYVEIV